MAFAVEELWCQAIGLWEDELALTRAKAEWDRCQEVPMKVGAASDAVSS